MPAYFDPKPEEPLDLPAHGSWPASRHRFESASIRAVRAALAARRPLLLRGEPGIGKSQLARAVATYLEVPFLYHVMDERSERDDLLYSYDAVARLAEAQVAGYLAREGANDWREKLAERNFIRPGVLWWAFDWDGAAKQAKHFGVHCRPCRTPQVSPGWTPARPGLCGPVVLVDEIDKADPSVPNGLLESLGNEGFQTEQLGAEVRLPEGAPTPLVIVTTNEERELPAAFLRRCFVLQMRFPPPEEARDFLLQRARVFFSENDVADSIVERAAGLLLADRAKAFDSGQAVPGAAEFLDLLRVLVRLHGGKPSEQERALQEVSPFVLQKNLSDR